MLLRLLALSTITRYSTYSPRQDDLKRANRSLLQHELERAPSYYGLRPSQARSITDRSQTMLSEGAPALSPKGESG